MPNQILDEYLPVLSAVELKVLLVIIRSTLGWVDGQHEGRRKKRDWIAGSQLRKRSGCSRRSVTTAVEKLVNRLLIEVLDMHGNLLDTPDLRKGQTRMYYRLCPEFTRSTGSPQHEQRLPRTWEKSAQALAQKMRITKESFY
ncbi:MAG: hypothetical protein WD077_14270 [Bacteroidia bacterium]